MTQYNEKKGKKWPNIMRKGQNDPIRWEKRQKTTQYNKKRIRDDPIR